jgi:hypothetical protein
MMIGGTVLKTACGAANATLHALENAFRSQPNLVCLRTTVRTLPFQIPYLYNLYTYVELHVLHSRSSRCNHEQAKSTVLFVYLLSYEYICLCYKKPAATLKG